MTTGCVGDFAAGTFFVLRFAGDLDLRGALATDDGTELADELAIGDRGEPEASWSTSRVVARGSSGVIPQRLRGLADDFRGRDTTAAPAE